MMPATLGQWKVLKMEVTSWVQDPEDIFGISIYLDDLDQNMTYFIKIPAPF